MTFFSARPSLLPARRQILRYCVRVGRVALSVLGLVFTGLLVPLLASAHAIPDIPVRSSFDASGAYTLTVEVDPRCFEADPNTTPSMLKSDLDKKTPAEREVLLAKAKDFTHRYVEYALEPQGRIEPSYVYDFTGEAGIPLVKPEDIVVITGKWQSTVPLGCAGYRIRAMPSNTLSVLFLNTLRGKPVERMQVLFPGEESYTLNLVNGAGSTAQTASTVQPASEASEWWETFCDFVREGFHHVVPLGMDHILFVLGVFLLVRAWRPLLWQVTAFTIAHTITLGLATLGLVDVPSSVVEPIIAGSIAVVAFENIFRPYYTPWRLLVVFGFGLIHGLGFAGALRDLNLPTSLQVVGLLGFNVGVEGGQLAVITGAFLLTFWISDKTPLGADRGTGLVARLTSGSYYRRFIVVPGSLLIAIAGLYWMVQRIVG